jgi:Ohr subfamily peroxiredoxin
MVSFPYLWLNRKSSSKMARDRATVPVKEKTMSITQIEKVLYTAKTHTTGGREGGSSRTSDGRLDVKLSIPGTPGAGTNPEQLFAVGWSSCFLSAVKIVAGAMKVKLPPDVAVDAEVDLGTANGGYLIQARLNVTLPGIEHEVAQKIVDGAHLQCPYSKATHGNINVVTTVRSEPAAQVA